MTEWPLCDLDRSSRTPLPPSTERAAAIDLVVSTQTDYQHMGGLVRFLRDLANPAAGPPFARIDALWSNAFLPPGQAATDDLVKVQQKAALIVDARRLGIPINKPFSKLVALPEAGVARVHGQEGLSLTVLGPSLEYVRAFAKFWLRDWKRRGPQTDDETSLTPGETESDADRIVDDLTIEGSAIPRSS